MNLKNTVEAIIFASGEPIDRIKLIDALGCSPERLDSILAEISAEYAERSSAIELLCLGSEVQFVTRPEYAATVRNVLDMKRNQPLSSAAFEVLAIIAYNQPVTKAFIEQVRGVDCSGVINTLCQRNLIEECGRLDLPGRPLLYCTTTDFLKCFCMSTLAELPEIPDTKAAAAALENIHNDDNVITGQMSIL
ncbi:MAG: SMC-Scp complex subunit ScpB [Clostridia bacterium]|nr:SMC-Scp complex subunit ScpB [Clostridia bacterium]